MSGHRGILVTGATGTVGRQVVARLLEAGCAVRAQARDPGAAGLSSGVDVVRGDLSEPHTLSSVAVREHERQADLLIARSGMEWTVLLPHAFMADALRWAGQIRSDGVVREPYGAAARPVVHEEDIAAVAVRALIGRGRADVVHLGGAGAHRGVGARFPGMGCRPRVRLRAGENAVRAHVYGAGGGVRDHTGGGGRVRPPWPSGHGGQATVQRVRQATPRSSS